MPIRLHVELGHAKRAFCVYLIDYMLKEGYSYDTIITFGPNNIINGWITLF